MRLRRSTPYYSFYRQTKSKSFQGCEGFYGFTDNVITNKYHCIKNDINGYYLYKSNKRVTNTFYI